ncbi:MAG: hypothetical protein KDK39_16995 [Leptospiraceae bacterium]|nr:hypothetical protein [Leptospiraceae bacterium]
MNTSQRSIHRAVVCGLLLLPLALWAEPPHGIVRDYNQSKKELSIVIQQPGLFLPGQTISIFRERAELGQVQVTQVFHTRVKARVVRGDNFQRKDLALKNKSDIHQLRKPEFNVVSFRSIGNPAHVWIARVSFPGVDAEVQTRPVTISNTIGVRLADQDYYVPIEADDIRSLQYEWRDGRMQGRQVVLKKGQTHNCSEILTPYILQRIKPPANARQDGQPVVITLQKKSRPARIRPDGLAVAITIEDAPNLFAQSALYLIKVYSSGLFINAFALEKTRIQAEILQQRFEIPGMELFAGQNTIEFYLVPARNQNGDLIESGEGKLIGAREINYSEQNHSHQFVIAGDGDDWELE